MSDLKPPGLEAISIWTDDMRMWPNVMYGDVYNFLISSNAVDGRDMKNIKSLFLQLFSKWKCWNHNPLYTVRHNLSTT